MCQGVHFLLVSFQAGKIFELGHQNDVEIVRIVRFGLHNFIRKRIAVGLERFLLALPISTKVRLIVERPLPSNRATQNTNFAANWNCRGLNTVRGAPKDGFAPVTPSL